VDNLNLPDREIEANEPDLELPNNSISTSKYNLITFLPKNLLEQFSKSANVYFLVVGLLQMVKEISVSNGQPVTLFPLIFIVVVSMLKDLAEDWKRKRSDNEENSKNVKVVKNGRLQTVKWETLRVGDVIKVENKQYFPCDVFLIGSKDPKGIAYIETKNLDGETNLKHKVVPKEVKKQLPTEEYAMKTNVVLSYEKPNPYLYTFTGTAKLKNNKIACDNANFVLRGCSLRNTEWIYGLVAYTGHQTKIMLNSVNAKPKKSRMEVKMSIKIYFIFLILLVLCFGAGLIYVLWMTQNLDQIPYLGITQINFVKDLFIRFGNWFLIVNNIVPISLLVTLEMVKVLQGLFISNDPRMHQVSTDISASVQSSSLNEELGQIDYVFSDKTGTLTQNLMEFKKLSVNGKPYGDGRDYDISNLPNVENVDFKDRKFFDILNQKNHPDHKAAHNYLKFLAICHTVIVQKEGSKNVYNASSPDEFALINYAKYMGYEFLGIDEENNMTVKFKGQVHKYKLLYVLEFSSARKRMSVIFKDEDDSIKIYSKGADSIIYKRMRKLNPKLASTLKNLEVFANEGLRTLLMAERAVTNEEFQTWQAKYTEATTSLVDREKKIEEVQEQIETGLKLVGATAIEDKLQDEVGETIGFIKEAGVKVWVLTGDKVETAINIAFSCNLITNEYNQIIIDGSSIDKVDREIQNAKLKLKPESKNAIIITGDALIHAMDKTLSSQLMEALEKCETVICSRVSPKQKQEVVALVRREKPSAITLAIGDGANDVNMIVGAHIGVGIRGVEGQQAARASDYAFGEFKFLKNLLFVHGRECYRRNAHLILYNFYKNIAVVAPHLWYGFINAFSGQSLFDPVFYQLFNMFLASLPIVIYAVYDREHDDDTLLRYPSLYQDSQQNRHFSNRKYWMWFVMSFYEAFIFFILPYYIMGNGAFGSSGLISSFWNDGNLVYLVVVVVVNLKILIFSHQYSILLLFTVFGSIGCFFLGHLVFNVMVSNEVYKTFAFYGMSWHTLNVPLSCFLLTVMLHMGAIRLQGLIDSQIPLEEPTKKIPVNIDTILDENYDGQEFFVSNRYKGFAFSVEERADEHDKKSHRN